MTTLHSTITSRKGRYVVFALLIGAAALALWLLFAPSHPRGPILIGFANSPPYHFAKSDGRPDLAERIAQLQPGIKILYASGYTEDVIARRGILLPGIAFLPKPFTQEDLLKKIREVLDS